jgi:hypothetical protein
MAKNMPTSGYQEILDKKIVHNNRENCKTNSFSMDTKPCVFSNLKYKLYKQSHSENRCTIMKEKYFISKCYLKTDALMHIGIHTKQIGNHLDNLVLNKNRYLKYK